MKQLQPRCKCGQAIEFPEGKNESKCPNWKCGMRWERGPEGYWALGLFTISFTPIFPRIRACTVRAKKDRYKNYPKAKRKGARR